MIGKISIGKDFGGCIRYVLEGKNGEKKEFAEVLHYNNCFGNKEELIQQFKDVWALNHKVEKPVWHTSLSFSEKDKLSKQQLIEISEKLASKFKFQDHQFIVVQHTDTKSHPHIHIVFNRIGFDAKAVKTYQNYKNIAEFNRKTEIEYNLERVLSPRKFLDKTKQSLPRNDKRKIHMKEIISEAISKSSNIDDFKSKVEHTNIEVEIGRGIAFIDEKGVRLKGSQVGYSLKKLTDHFKNKNRNKSEIIQKKLRTNNIRL